MSEPLTKFDIKAEMELWADDKAGGKTLDVIVDEAAAQIRRLRKSKRDLDIEIGLTGDYVDVCQGPCPGGCGRQVHKALWCLTCWNKKLSTDNAKLQERLIKAQDFNARLRLSFEGFDEETEAKIATLRKALKFTTIPARITPNRSVDWNQPVESAAMTVPSVPRIMNRRVVVARRGLRHPRCSWRSMYQCARQSLTQLSRPSSP